MIFTILGSDSRAVAKKRQDLLAVLSAKRPDSEIFPLDTDTLDEATLDSLILGQGLFEQKYIVSGNRLFSEKETSEMLLSKLIDMAESPNVFVLSEIAPDKKLRDELEKHSEKFFSTDTAKTAAVKKEERFNVFALGDALGAKDKRSLWVLYQKALRAGLSPEEIHGTLFWQVKSMLLAGAAKTPEEAGMKAFPYKKSKRYSSGYSRQRLISVSRELVDLYHNARAGAFDLETGLERWMLDL